MSWIEQVVNKPVEVISQYDYPFVSNQCSWCAYELAMRSKYIINQLENNENSSYNAAITKGTERREKCNKFRCGENIDDEEILNTYKDYISIEEWGQVVLGQEQADMYLSCLGEELRNVFFTLRHTEKEIKDLEKDVKDWLPQLGRLMVINRYGQSFSMVGIDENKILLLDSHFHCTGYTTPNKAFEYVLQDHGGYNIIMWGKGTVKNM